MQPNTPADDLGIDDVAARLGESHAWLKWRLSIDRGEPEPRLQHHHYFGRTPKWTESEYQQLRQALMTRTPPKGGRQRQPSPTAALANSPSLPERTLAPCRPCSGQRKEDCRVRASTRVGRDRRHARRRRRTPAPKGSRNRRRPHLGHPSFSTVRNRGRQIPEPAPGNGRLTQSILRAFRV